LRNKQRFQALLQAKALLTLGTCRRLISTHLHPSPPPPLPAQIPGPEEDLSLRRFMPRLLNQTSLSSLLVTLSQGDGAAAQLRLAPGFSPPPLPVAAAGSKEAAAGTKGADAGDGEAGDSEGEGRVAAEADLVATAAAAGRAEGGAQGSGQPIDAPLQVVQEGSAAASPGGRVAGAEAEGLVDAGDGGGADVRSTGGATCTGEWVEVEAALRQLCVKAAEAPE
jgi:hypothetical protein